MDLGDGSRKGVGNVGLTHGKGFAKLQALKSFRSFSSIRFGKIYRDRD
jgi:hypothetical protein